MRDPELKDALEGVLAHRQGKHALSHRTITLEPSEIKAIRSQEQTLSSELFLSACSSKATGVIHPVSAVL